MKVVIWATHLQTDILALTMFLDRRQDVDLLVVTQGAARYLEEPIARVRPLRAPVLDRDAPGTLSRVRAFAADVVVADNHLPLAGIAPRLFYMWHGMGWKARGKLDLEVFYRQVKLLTGIDPRQPNPRFRAQCYGPTDLAWRIDNWGLHPSNCAEIGMCFSDMLLDPPYTREEVAKAYRIDVRRPTVLLSITWHYGGVFASEAQGNALARLLGRSADHDGDMAFLRAMLAAVERRNANLLICLHDRKRYDPALLARMEREIAGKPHVELRFKDEHPDNLSDLLVADVMVSNLSSFLVYHYVLGRPSVHVLPASADRPTVERIFMLFSRFRLRSRLSAEDAWMLDPRDVGGLVAQDAAQAVDAVERSLDDPGPGARLARSWLARHIRPLDGRASQRFFDALVALCQAPPR